MKTYGYGICKICGVSFVKKSPISKTCGALCSGKLRSERNYLLGIAWRIKNRERALRVRRQWAAKNRKKLSKANKVWYYKCREEILEGKKVWRYENREKMLAYKKVYKKTHKTAVFLTCGICEKFFRPRGPQKTCSAVCSAEHEKRRHKACLERNRDVVLLRLARMAPKRKERYRTDAAYRKSYSDYSKLQVSSLSDNYVMQLLLRGSKIGLKKANLPKEIIELKRTSVAVNRILKNKPQNEIKL